MKNEKFASTAYPNPMLPWSTDAGRSPPLSEVQSTFQPACTCEMWNYCQTIMTPISPKRGLLTILTYRWSQPHSFGFAQKLISCNPIRPSADGWIKASPFRRGLERSFVSKNFTVKLWYFAYFCKHQYIKGKNMHSQYREHIFQKSVEMACANAFNWV